MMMQARVQNRFGRRGVCQILAFAAVAGVTGIPRLARSASVDPLSRFFSEVQTLHAAFHQSVLTEDLQSIDESDGELWLSRPGRFRWEYGDPLEQVVVADGQQVWVYDPGLEQAVVRNQDEMLGDTPAGLLAGNADPSLSYLVEVLGKQEGIDWISIFPKSSDAAFAQIQFGFELDTLRMVQMLDPLQQITRIRFWNVNVNLDIPVGKFSLTLPDGTDIIREGNA
ncbi:outer membrane lipoprotein chaperone LolA [Gammaproteobacteria bacterium]|nr:outer membrane lipoprotein chaperone LolA [Gammaproteobacteria bacterium]